MGAPTCKVLRVTHTGLTVNDMQRASRFFRDVLGFSVTEPMRQAGPAVGRMIGVPGAVLDIAFCTGGGHTIELLHYVSPPPQGDFDRQHNETGFAHIAFAVEDIDAAAAAVRAAGFELFGAPEVVPAGPRKGGKNLYARDVAGIVIELQQAPPPPAGAPA